MMDKKMDNVNVHGDRCILMYECSASSADTSYSTLPQARCAANPPDDPLLLYPLCLDCDLFHQKADRALFSKISSNLAESLAVVVERESSFELGYAAMRKMLERLSIGDSDARVVLPADVGILRDLEPLLNRMADFMKEQVEESHEIAIGLCEHYETLLRLAGGDLESRASTASPIELIAKLGELINRQSETFLEAINRLSTKEQELHHAQKLDSIGQLAGGIAHEFNNILAAILGYAGILEMRLGSESPNLTAVQRIISASEKAASLTRSMLTFSRKEVVALEPIQINSFISGMKEMLSRLAGENIKTNFHLNPTELILNADLGQLQQIVLNLYNNARDAMQDGGCLTITTLGRTICGTENDAPSGIIPGRYVQLIVADTGRGIRPEALNRIYDPFYTTKEVGTGTGLGLSIVFGIVQQHNGFIQVASTPGQGTTFALWFSEYDVGERSHPDRTLFSQRNSERIGRTVLVGEDNEDVRPMIVELLQDCGYRVLEACDGSEVVSLMDNFGDTVDLLLLDAIMPRMNGYEALAAVREQYPELPCLFLSGYSDDILKQKAKISGEFEYLTKPIMPDRLIAAVQAALEGREYR